MNENNRLAFHNAQVVESGRVQVDAFGPLALWGEGIFDTFRVHNGRVLYHEAHHERLMDSCHNIWGEHEERDSHIHAARAFLQKHAHAYAEGKGRILVAPSDPLGKSFDVFAEIERFVPLEAVDYQRGVTVNYSQIRHPGLGAFGKSTSALWSRMASKEAHAQGVDEVILCRDEIVVEAAWSALLWKEGEHWRSPESSLAALPSTTLHALRELGVSIKTVIATKERLCYADAIVLLSSLRLAMGVASLDGRSFSDPDREAAPLRELLLRA